MAIRISRRLIGMTAAHVAVALDRARSAPAVTVRVRVSRAISPYDDRSTTPLRVLPYATAFLSRSPISLSLFFLSSCLYRGEKGEKTHIQKTQDARREEEKREEGEGRWSARNAARGRADKGGIALAARRDAWWCGRTGTVVPGKACREASCRKLKRAALTESAKAHPPKWRACDAGRRASIRVSSPAAGTYLPLGGSHPRCRSLPRPPPRGRTGWIWIPTW